MTEVSDKEINAISEFVSRHNKVSAITAGKILRKYDFDTVKFRIKYLEMGIDEWGWVVYSVRPEWIHLAKKLSFTERFKNWMSDMWD